MFIKLNLQVTSILWKNIIKDAASPFSFPFSVSHFNQAIFDDYLFGICKLEENSQIVFIKIAL